VTGEAKSVAIRLPVRSGVKTTRSSSEQIGRTLFALYCVDAAFDFHSQADSGNTLQITLGIFSLLAFVLFALNARRTIGSLPLLRRVVWIWWIYLATTPVVAYLRGFPYTHFLRVALPEVLMGTSLIMGYILLSESRNNAGLIFKGIFYSSCLSSIVHLIRGFSMGLGLDEVRYYIASPLLIVMVSFALYRLLFEGSRSGLFNLVALCGGLMIIFLSVTRTYFVSVGSILVAIGMILLRPPKWLKRGLQRRIFWNLLLISLVLAFMVGLVVVVFPSVLEHWSSRSSSLGTQDPTALTRIAEAAGEVEAMTADTSHLLIGSGLGSEHKFDERYLIGIAAAAHEATEDNYAPGHIGWIYQFYASGILLGWVYLFVFFVAIWKGNSSRGPYIARMAGVALIAVLVTSTFGNMLGDRSGGIGVGLLIALSLYGAEDTGKMRKVRRIVQPKFEVQPFRHTDGLSGSLQSANENGMN
jgi:hypothetical protein